MKRIISLAITSSFACISLAQVLDLGDLTQYAAQLAMVPAEIQANDIWISQGTGGYHIALGKDVRGKVQGVLKGCVDINNQCYQDVNKIFDSANFQIDKKLDRRGFASLLSKTFKSSIGFFLDVSALLLANWKLKSQEMGEMGMWLPDSRATEAGVLVGATALTISAGNSAVATITQAPDTTPLRGSATPSVTAVTATKAGYALGDLVALLDKSLASRIDEIMHRSLECKDGQDFDLANPPKKRASGTYGQAICAAEAVAAGAMPQGPMNDLLLLNPAQLPFGFADAAGTIGQAATVFAGFVQAYAPLMTIPPELIDQLAVFIFALAIDTIMSGLALGEENRIQSSLVKTSVVTSATSTASGCPNPTALPCGIKGEKCPMKMPESPKIEPTCLDGQHKDCECRSPPTIHFNMVSPDQQRIMMDMFKLLKNTLALNKPICPVALTEVPMGIFSSKDNQVYPYFCQNWHADTASKMTLNSTGKNRNPEPHLIRKRTPMNNAANYKDWNFDLSFTPSKGSVACLTDCNGAYEKFRAFCASGSSGSYMYEQGEFDVGCGKFTYKVYNPTTALRTFAQFCYRATDFAPLAKGGVEEWELRTFTGWACGGSALENHKIKKDDKSTFIQWTKMVRDVPYQYNVWWKDGCILGDSRPSEAFASNPLMVEKNPSYTVCQDTLTRNWRDCDNGGVGGNIQVGCLIFEFKADNNTRRF